MAIPKLAAVATAAGMLAAWTLAHAEPPVSSIGYRTVAEALAALRADPTAIESSQSGWTVFTRESDLEIWSFTPQRHPAHPSAAKRTIYQDGNGAWHVITRLLCQSTKVRCDALMQEYQLLDKQMRDRIRRERGSGA